MTNANDIIKINNVKKGRLAKLSPIKSLLDIDGVILAGGAARSVFDGSSISDFDLFLTHHARLEPLKQELVNLGAVIKFICPLGELISYSLGGLKIQVILKRRYFSVNDLLGSFDFTVCQFALAAGQYYTSMAAMRDAHKKELRIPKNLNEIEYPVATINRIHKYRNKGYNSYNAITRIVELIAEMDPEDLNPENMALYVD